MSNPPQKIKQNQKKNTQLPPKKKVDPVKMALQALAILVLYEKKRMEETNEDMVKLLNQAIQESKHIGENIEEKENDKDE